ncbi:MAG: hypothetical protein FWE24_01235 [Defluviitaleaceae bacterium]|nr:hypothetical protein [Defluviitaleaceae bacterium]
MDKLLELLFRRIFDNDTYERIKPYANFNLKKWQWKYIIHVALKIDANGGTVAENRIDKVYSIMSAKYGFEGREPENIELLGYTKKIRDSLLIVENNLWLAPQRLIYNFVVERNDCNHVIIKNFLAQYNIAYNPPLPIESLYKQISETCIKKHSQQISFLTKVLGEEVYNGVINKDGCKILSAKGLGLILTIADVTSNQRDMIECLFGMRTEDDKEMRLFEVVKLLDIDAANLYRAEAKFCNPNVQKVLIECLEGCNENIDSIMELAQKQAFKRRFYNLHNFYYKLMKKAVYYELSRNELDLMLDVAQVKCDTDRKIISDYLGVNAEKMEKLCKNIQATNKQGKTLNTNEITGRVKIILEQLLNTNSMGAKIIESFIKGDAKFISEISYRKNNKKQLDLINKYARTPQRINTPFHENMWDEVLRAFQFNDKHKQVFKLFYGVNGEGEMSISDITQKLGTTPKESSVIYGVILSKFERYRDDLELLIENYYCNNIFDTSYVCRKKQKAFLKEIMQDDFCGNMNVVLSKAQWDLIFEEARFNKREKAIVSYNFGIGCEYEYEYKEIRDKVTPLITEGGVAAIIRKAHAKLKSEGAKLLVLEFINANYFRSRSFADGIFETAAKADAALPQLSSKTVTDL